MGQIPSPNPPLPAKHPQAGCWDSGASWLFLGGLEITIILKAINNHEGWKARGTFSLSLSQAEPRVGVVTAVTLHGGGCSPGSPAMGSLLPGWMACRQAQHTLPVIDARSV